MDWINDWPNEWLIEESSIDCWNIIVFLWITVMSFYTEWQLTLLADHNELFIFHLSDTPAVVCLNATSFFSLSKCAQKYWKLRENSTWMNTTSSLEGEWWVVLTVLSHFDLLSISIRAAGLWSSILGVWDLFNGKKYFLYLPRVDISLAYFRLHCIKIHWEINF